MIVVCCPKFPKGGLKNAKRPICVKNALRLKKVCYKVSCDNCQRQSCKAFLGLTNRAKVIAGGRSHVPEILDQNGRVGAKSSIFVLFSLIAPQPLHLCENCQGQSCKAFIGPTIRAKMIGVRRPLVPDILSQNDRVGAKFEQQAAITSKRYEIGCQLLLITNRKSHTGFRLVSILMTLSDLERRNSPYFAFFHGVRQIFRSIISQWLKIDL